MSSSSPTQPSRTPPSRLPIHFVLWGFPEPTQTFIHRELEALVREGVSVHIVGGARRDPSGQSDAIVELANRALYLGSPLGCTLRAVRSTLRQPRRVLGELVATARRPHRSAWHRLRASAMVLAAASLQETVQRSGARYLHAHFGAYQTELTMSLARLCDLPWGATFHATDIWKDANLLPDKLAGAAVVLTCTAHNAEHLRSLAPEHAHKVALIPHGLDLDAIGPAAPWPSARVLRLIAVGRLVAKKGFACLLEAAANLREGGAEFELTIVGEGPERAALERRVKELQLGTCVTLVGAQPHRSVLERMRASHALVVPSVRAVDGDLDGIPNVILEAFALGRPVVASQISGIPEVVRPRETGWLVAPNAPNALANALGELNAARETAAAYGSNGRRLIEAQYDVVASSHATLEAISNSLSS